MRLPKKLAAGALALTVALAIGVVAAMSTDPLTGEAYGAYADMTAVDLTATPRAVLPGTGMDTDEALSVGVAGVVEAKNLTSLTTGSGQTGNASVEAISTAEDVDVLSGLVTASALVAISSSAVGNGTAGSDAEGSTFTDLVVNGVAFPSVVEPNTRVEIPGVATVVLNEQLPVGDGISSSGLTVNMIHVWVQDALGGQTGEEIVVGSARSLIAQ